jgi:4-amino-4-deoxy-L-arabinose transferase-like glycosyltransferase
MFKRYFTRNNLFFLVLILAAGIFLRVFKIGTNYYFTGELGKELLYMRQFAVSHSFPLVGMTTSHEWLSYGPIYYWIMIPIFNLFSGNPFILFWSALAVSILGLILSYLVFEKIAGERVAMFSTMIQALSPLLIWQTRLSKLHVFFFLIMPVLTYLLYLLWNGKKKWVLPTGIVFGILFSFHFSQIPILGVIIFLFWIKRNIYKISDWIKFGIGVLIPNITLIWPDKSLALWLPYRILNITYKDPAGTLRLLNEYFGKNIFWDSRLWIIGLIIFIAVFVHYIIKNKRRFTKDFLPFYLISSISLMCIANILHGGSPIHYFLPVFMTLPVLYAIYLNKFKFWYLIVIPVVLINLISFTNDPIFYKSFTGLIPNTDMVSYSTQSFLSSFVVADAKGKPLSVKRIGAYDYFPENYSQNYKYLILWQGGNLVEDSKNIYTIVEDPVNGEINVQK